MKKLLILLLTLCSFCIEARPAEIEVHSATPNGSFTFTRHIPGFIPREVAGGRFEISLTEDYGWWDGDYLAYCIDPYQYLRVGTYDYELLKLSDITAAHLLHEAHSIVGGFSDFSHAERQKWIWELGFETAADHLSLSSGDVTITGTGGIAKPFDPLEPVHIAYLHHPLYQDLLIWKVNHHEWPDDWPTEEPPKEAHSVPSPSTIGLILIGLLFLHRHIRRTM